MEKLADKLKDLETPYLIEVVLNYQGFGYPEEAKDIALGILKERNIDTAELEKEVAHMVLISQEVHYYIGRVDELNKKRTFLKRLAFLSGFVCISLILIISLLELDTILPFPGFPVVSEGFILIPVIAFLVLTLIVICILFIRIKSLTEEILNIIYKDLEHKRPESLKGVDIQEEIQKFKSIHSNL